STTSQTQSLPSSGLRTLHPTCESSPLGECESFAPQNVFRCDSIWDAAAGGLTTTLRWTAGPAVPGVTSPAADSAWLSSSPDSGATGSDPGGVSPLPCCWTT